jgi:hypothetical protein
LNFIPKRSVWISSNQGRPNSKTSGFGCTNSHAWGMYQASSTSGTGSSRRLNQGHSQSQTPHGSIFADLWGSGMQMQRLFNHLWIFYSPLFSIWLGLCSSQTKFPPFFTSWLATPWSPHTLRVRLFQIRLRCQG